MHCKQLKQCTNDFYYIMFIIQLHDRPHAGDVIMGNLNVIPDARVCNIISKGPKYRFPSNIGFPNCHMEIAALLIDFSKLRCK